MNIYIICWLDNHNSCLPRMNIYIYLHHPGQFYDSDSKTKIYVNQGKRLYIDLTYELSRVSKVEG